MLIGSVICTTCFPIARNHFDPYTFFHPILSNSNYINGMRLVIDSRYDIACVGKYVFVEEFIMKKFITAKGYTTDLGSLDDISISFFV